jgi:Pheromone A receptor
MAISVIQVLFIIPFSAYFMWSYSRTLRPWPGWADTHRQWSDIPTVPGVSWRADPSAEPSRWLAVITAFVYFIFMESGKNSWTNFRRGLVWMTRCGARYAPANIALRMSTLGDFLTVSQRSEQVHFQSMPQLSATGNFHPTAPTDNLAEMALASDKLEPQPEASSSEPALPVPAHLPSLRGASNGGDEWTSDSLYRGKKMGHSL